MMEMVSNVRCHKDIEEAAIRRNEGVRCSKRVLDGMCLQMATTSFQQTMNNNNKLDFEGNIDDIKPCSSNSLQMNQKSEYETNLIDDAGHHPVLSIIGPLFAPDDFEIMELLGEGFFSKVFKVKHISTGEILVLKESKPTGACRRTSHSDTAREASIMRRLKHENVLRLRGICISREQDGKWDTNLLVSYCEGGSLANLVLDKQKQISWYRRVRYARDIASAMEYIHDQQIIHRDLTSSNVLIRHDTTPKYTGWGRAVVADFGLSCPFPKHGEKLAQVGTTYFMSPECLKEEFYDEKSDVFSFGIILCQMIARIDVDPDGGMPRTSKFGFDYMLFTPLCPLDTPIELLKLAFNSCVMDPTARPSFNDARRKLDDILGTLPIPPINRNLEMSSSSSPRDGKESRLGRSRSDAALKRPKSLATSATNTPNRKLSMLNRGVIEGESIDESVVNRMEKLARDVARDEPEFRHINPFLDHERFRNERKILPPKKISSTPRRKSEAKTDCASPSVSSQFTSISTLRRRCMSLPSSVNDSLIFEHYTSFSYDGSDENRDESKMDDIDYIDANQSPASGIPMAYRDFDRKFLKQMMRFPSRRHTMHQEAATASNFEICQENNRRFGGGKEREEKADTLPSTKYSDGDKKASIVMFNETPQRQKRKLQRMCSSAHKSAQECSIL